MLWYLYETYVLNVPAKKIKFYLSIDFLKLYTLGQGREVPRSNPSPVVDSKNFLHGEHGKSLQISLWLEDVQKINICMYITGKKNP